MYFSIVFYLQAYNLCIQIFIYLTNYPSMYTLLRDNKVSIYLCTPYIHYLYLSWPLDEGYQDIYLSICVLYTSYPLSISILASR